MTLISTTVTSTVYLGQDHVGNALVVGSKGDIAPATYGATGIVGGTAKASITNHGTISGAYSGTSTTIAGGNAIALNHGGGVINTGVILGGNAYFGNTYEYGGTAIVGAGVTLSNTGNIAGGYGDGVGLDLSVSTITNHGTIAGGAGLADASNNGAYGGGTGGVGAELTGGHLNNAGWITGGKGGNYNGKYNDAGTGGSGIDANGGAIVSNTGLITGGAGGDNETSPGGGSNGGVGVVLSGAQLVNAGTIRGGTGYQNSDGRNYAGDGVILSGGTVTNTGTIMGGIASSSSLKSLGAGVYINGGTLITSGLIAGSQLKVSKHFGDAVVFGKTAATLELQSGATFVGNIAANGTNDTLLLAGAAAGTLAGLGSQFAGFTTVTEAAGATWTLSGTTTLAASTLLTANGSLTFGGDVTGAGTVALTTASEVTVTGALNVSTVEFTAGSNQTLLLDKPASTTATLAGFAQSDKIDLVNLLANGARFANGTLTLLENGAAVATLTLAGDYATANFNLISDGGHGTDIVYVATAASVPAVAASYGIWHPADDGAGPFPAHGHIGW